MSQLKNSAPPLASVSETLTEILARPITKADQNQAAFHLLDWLGCALAGYETETGKLLSIGAGSMSHPFGGVGSGRPDAILAMGGLGSILEMDDVHRTALLHPGPVIMPVVLGANRDQLTPERILRAIIKGYEAMIRFGAAVGKGHYDFFHNTATCGGLGAAVAASHLLGLSRQQTTSAIGHATSLAGGLWQCRHEPVATKHLHVAETARRGFQAARFAQAGLAGPRFVLEGPQGYFAAIAKGGLAASITEDTTRPWQIHDTSFKPWPACRHTHPSIDAALILRQQLCGRVPKRIEIRTFGDAIIFCDKPNPQTTAEAMFSLQHAVAVALSDGPPKLEAFEPSKHTTYSELRQLIHITEGEQFSNAYPAHFGAEIVIELAEGEMIEADVLDAWGDSENPMSEDASIAKFRNMSTWAKIPADAQNRLLDAALGLAKKGSAQALIDAMRLIETITSTRNL